MKTLLVMITMLTITVSCSKENTPKTHVNTGVVGDNLLEANAQKIIDDYDIPAIAAMSMKSGNILEKIELGNKVYNSNDPIESNSKWHIGSISKSMTATLTAILVEKGYVTWNLKIRDITTDGYLEEYQNVSLYELLSMTAGITPSDYPIDPNDTRPVSEIRQEWAIIALNEPQKDKESFVYSNSSYIVAAVLIELIMEETWEELITTHLFNELGMNNTGFGAPGNNGELNQPWGHRRAGAAWEEKDPTSLLSDNPKALGPAGIIHTTLEDMAKYANLHLGKTSLLNTASLQLLHTEVNNSGYALGWNVTENGIFHSGSNTNWFAQLFINLDQEFVNFSVTNSYDLDGNISVPAVQQMMGIMGQRYENSF